MVTLRTVHVYEVVPVAYRRWDEVAHRLREPGARCLPAESMEGRARRAAVLAAGGSPHPLPAGRPPSRLARPLETLDVVANACQKLESLLRRRRPHRLEVSVTEPDVRVRPVGVLVEVEERPGPELQVRGVPADLYQAVDRAQGSDQILVVYPGAVIRFPQLSRRQRSARLPTADPTRRHGRRSSVAAPAMSSRFASELGPPIGRSLLDPQQQASDDGAVVSRVAQWPGGLELLRARLEHAEAVGRQLIGLSLDDARELAAASRCHLRVYRRDGPGSVVTAELDVNRINVTVEDEIVVGVSTG
jgi:hypothetical protein